MGAAVQGARAPVGSDQLNDLPLGIHISLDVPLGSAERGVASKHLHVAQRTTYGRYLPSRVGDEGPTAGVAGAAMKSETPEPVSKEIGDHCRGCAR